MSERGATRIERFLRVFTEIRGGEGRTALLMTLNIFCIGTCYYILKPAREAFLAVHPDGAEVASYAAGVMAVVLIPFVWAYGWLGRRFDRRILIAGVTGFFVVNLGAFYVLAEAGFELLGHVFFVWLGIFNLSIISQFWAYGNDIYSREQGKRLFPLILLGQNTGAILGPLVAAQAVRIAGSTSIMLLVAAVVLIFSILLTLLIDQRQRTPSAEKPEERPAQTLGPEGGFELIWKHRYLLYIALLMVVLNLVNTTGEYILRSIVYDTAQGHPQPDVYAANYYSYFFLAVNSFGLAVQALLVSRLLKWVGVRGALLIPAVLALGGYSLIVAVPLLLVVTLFKVVENATDYTLMNTLRAALYLPTTREMKYKAKQAIDTFFVRLGDVLSSGVVFAGTRANLTVSAFAGITVALSLAWLLLVGLIRREYGRMAGEDGEPEVAQEA